MAASVEKCIEIGIGLGGLHDCVKRRFCQNGEFARFMRRCNPYNCTKNAIRTIAPEAKLTNVKLFYQSRAVCL